MKPTLIWLLLAGVGSVLLLGDSVDAWNRHYFNRYSRNWLQNQVDGGGVAADGKVAGNFNRGAGIASNSPQINDFNLLFGLGDDVNSRGNGGVDGGGETGIGKNFISIGNGGGSGGSVGYATFDGGYDVDTGGFGAGQQQTEIYGIVEPLIEDTPCVDRACQVNDDCCPTGVCVNTYGEGKCIYVYGRKRDLCHRNSDCDLGMLCLKSVAGNLMCQPSTSTIHLFNNIGANSGNSNDVGVDGTNMGGGVGVGNNAVGLNNGANISPNMPLNVKQFDEDCISSSDCNVAKGLCCQFQRTHHRIHPRKLCAYFRDPFMCIGIMPTENKEDRNTGLLSTFSQRRM
ncbi:uncharacterized protein spab [Eurosta solidaginis]|uniref:uncharacterized protein spab n=1 Tax=Eurosta solidaginis TaxID=178769 RepID=UPI0035312CF0